MKSKFVISFLFFGCTACSLGPDYQRPELDVPAIYPEEIALKQEKQMEPANVGNLKWWEVFQDEELQKLIKAGLENNYDLKLAVARIAEARGVLGVTSADQYPMVNAAGAYARQRTSETTASGKSSGGATINDNSLSLDLSFELDLWGKLRKATEASEAQLLATEEAANIVRQALVAQIAQTYFTLRAQDQALEISKRTLSSGEESLRLVQYKEQGGAGSQLDVRQAEVLVVTAAAAIPRIESVIAQAEHALSILVGSYNQPIPRGKAVENMGMTVSIPSDLPSQLIERRPDVRAAEAKLVAANANISVAKAAFFPSISLTAFGGKESEDLSDLFDNSSRVWGFGPSVSLPIFTAGKLSSNLEIAEARKEQAMLEYKQIVQQAFREVLDGLVSYQKAKEYRREEQRLVFVLSDAAKLTRAKYEGGVTSYFEVLDIERQLFAAEITAAEAFRDELNSYVSLYKALGGGWDM